MKVLNARARLIEPGAVEVRVDKALFGMLERTILASPSGYFYFELKKPFRPRSVGRRSQCNRFRGGCRDIAEQLEYHPDQIAEAIKRMAIDEGYPKRRAIDGTVIPISEADCSVEESAILLKVLNRFADEHNLYLTEYDESQKPYHSVGGRTRAEMQRWVQNA